MRILVDLKKQKMFVFNASESLVKEYSISTAARGAGETKGSYQTPRGLHCIRAKIGAGLPVGSVLKARRPTGEICTPELLSQNPDRDWILSRILWLSGKEPGFNRLGAYDTMARFIYIHGTPDTEPMGKPVSHGCIRMRNQDVIELFDLVSCGTEVVILDEKPASQAVCLSWRQAHYFLKKQNIQFVDQKNHKAWHLIVWGSAGEVLAYARINAEGCLDYCRLNQPDALKPLLEKSVQRARQLGWREMRAAVAADLVGYFSKEGFELRGDRFVWDQLEVCTMRLFV